MYCQGLFYWTLSQNLGKPYTGCYHHHHHHYHHRVLTSPSLPACKNQLFIKLCGKLHAFLVQSLSSFKNHSFFKTNVLHITSIFHDQHWNQGFSFWKENLGKQLGISGSAVIPPYRVQGWSSWKLLVYMGLKALKYGFVLSKSRGTFFNDLCNINQFS